MSDRQWGVRIHDMLDCCARIADYTDGMTRDQLDANPLTYDAILWNLTVLGEAAKGVPADVRTEHPEIPWANIAGTRDRVIHGYGSVQPDRVWEIVSSDIPELMPRLRALLAEDSDAS